MGSRNERHVMPHPYVGSKVARPGAGRAIERTGTQADGINRASILRRDDDCGELVIQGRDGRIRALDATPPGSDPFAPADRL